MPDLNSPTDIADALSAPLGELIAAVGRGVAEAQQALDEATIKTFREIYGTYGRKSFEVLRELGYQPTWYKIPEVDAEISVSLSISGAVESASRAVAPSTEETSKIKLYAAPIDANYTNKYDYDIRAASTIRFKIVPVPPSPQSAAIKVVPMLTNKTYGQAKALLTDLEIPFKLAIQVEVEPADNSLLQGSLPEAGEILSPGQSVELILSQL